MKKKIGFLFALAMVFSTCGMILLEPWLILEAVDGAGISRRHLFGYALMGATALANIATATQLGRLRGRQFGGATPWRKFLGVGAGLVLAMALFLISYLGGSVAAQLLVQ
jgi:hypothetical protein